MSIGYPDYIRESKQAGSLIYSGTFELNTSNFSPNLYIGDYQYLLITCDATATTHMVGLSPVYAIDPAFVTQMGGTIGAISPGIVDSILARVRGPWLSLEVYPWDATSTDKVKVYIYGTNAPPTGNVGVAATGPWAYSNAAIAASGSTTLFPLGWHSGTAVMAAYCSSATALVVSVDQYEYLIGWQGYINEQTVTANRTITFEVPIAPIPTRIRLVNTTASSVNVAFMGMPRGLATI